MRQVCVCERERVTVEVAAATDAFKYVELSIMLQKSFLTAKKHTQKGAWQGEKNS